MLSGPKGAHHARLPPRPTQTVHTHRHQPDPYRHETGGCGECPGWSALAPGACPSGAPRATGEAPAHPSGRVASQGRGSAALAPPCPDAVKQSDQATTMAALGKQGAPLLAPELARAGRPVSGNGTPCRAKPAREPAKQPTRGVGLCCGHGHALVWRYGVQPCSLGPLRTGSISESGWVVRAIDRGGKHRRSR